MTLNEFKALAHKDHEAAAQEYVAAAVEEWMQEGQEEVVRCILCWLENGTNPAKMNAEHLIDMAEEYPNRFSHEDEE